jgi:putative transposase
VSRSGRRQSIRPARCYPRRTCLCAVSACCRGTLIRRRDFSAHAPKVSWCGDITEIPTGEGKLTWPWCGTCGHRRRRGGDVLTQATGLSYRHARTRTPNWRVARSKSRPRCAVATPATEGVVLRTLRGSTFTARYFTVLAGVSGRVSRRAEWDRVSTMPPPRRSSPCWKTRFCPGTASPRELRAVRSWSPDALDFYNTRRRHSSARSQAPGHYGKTDADRSAAASLR